MTQNGGAAAPQSGVDAYPVPTNTDTDAHFTVKGDGAGTAFCVHIERIRSKEDDYTPPGVAGALGPVTYRGYRLDVEGEGGEC
ncbi:hypothetical protein ABT147_19115 [Streptomyces sp. NPDC001868]|uniref:hypothetical protein n=1 Tax=Streptomyces sp. NPDC001868 TaxID=3154401 RepID=UPI0033251BC7